MQRRFSNNTTLYTFFFFYFYIVNFKIQLIFLVKYLKNIYLQPDFIHKKTTTYFVMMKSTLLKQTILVLLFSIGISISTQSIAQGLYRGYIFYNPSPQKASGLTKELKQLLDVAATQSGYVNGHLLQSVSGKNQMVASVLWNSQKSFAHWRDSVLKKQVKLTVSKVKVQQKSGVLERRMEFEIKGQFVPDNEKIKSYSLNDYASLSYWTTNEDLKEGLFIQMNSAFDSTKKFKGFHYGELGFSNENKKTVTCITMTYWDKQENSVNVNKYIKTKTKVNPKAKTSLISNEFLEKKTENKRYKVIYIKAS